MDSNFIVHVNDSFNYKLKNTDVKNLDVIKLNTKNYHLLKNQKPYQISIKTSNFEEKAYTITVNHTNYDVKITNQIDNLIKEMGFNNGLSKKMNTIKAPMPGIILNILVKKDDQVNEGDTLVILEAMKMENTITSPKKAIVKNILISTNQTVDKGQLLIELA
jgi:biotin carboxyl carrier protein